MGLTESHRQLVPHVPGDVLPVSLLVFLRGGNEVLQVARQEINAECDVVQTLKDGIGDEDLLLE